MAGYAVDGAGFAVSFDRSKLDMCLKDSAQGSSLSLEKVSYGNQDWAETNDIIRSLHETFSEDAAKYEEGPDGFGYLMQKFTPEKRRRQHEVARSLFTVKNGAFREEKEWRLFLFDWIESIENVQFRESRNLISPYVSLTIPPEAIVAVTLGPTNPTPEAMVKQALMIHGIECGVSRSISSYRNS